MVDTLLKAPPYELKTADDYAAAIEAADSLSLEWESRYREDPVLQSLYNARRNLAQTYVIQLAGEMREAFPDDPRLADILLIRFEYSPQVYRLDITAEVEDYARRYQGQPKKVREARYWLAMKVIRKSYRKAGPINDALDEFERYYRDGADDLAQLYQRAYRYLNGVPAQTQMFERMKAAVPESEEFQRIQGRVEQEALQQKLMETPFELDFTDQLTGRRVSLRNLRGKVVVLDFWATWCGPCVAEVPHMLELYERYKDRGVEFIGISLDSQPAALKKFCEERGITWPQYCEPGKTWETSVAQRSGVRSVPTLFVLDKTGRVASTNARGRLAAVIEENLRK